MEKVSNLLIQMQVELVVVAKVLLFKVKGQYFILYIIQYFKPYKNTKQKHLCK